MKRITTGHVHIKLDSLEDIDESQALHYSNTRLT